MPPRRQPTVAPAQHQRSLRSFATKVSKGTAPRAAAKAKETVAAGTKRKIDAAKISAAIAIIQDGDEDVVINTTKRVRTVEEIAVKEKEEVTVEEKEEVATKAVELEETVAEEDITSEEASEEEYTKESSTEPLTEATTEKAPVEETSIEDKSATKTPETEPTVRRSTRSRKTTTAPKETALEENSPEPVAPKKTAPKKAAPKKAAASKKTTSKTASKDIPAEESTPKPKKVGPLDAFITRSTPAAPTPTPKKVSATNTLANFLTKSPATGLFSRSGNIPPPTASDAGPCSTSGLPASLTNLITFHSALLTSLLLHKAQNSSGIYPSFAILKPQIELLTSRRISLADIQKIVFLSHYNTPSSTSGSGLSLLDYGATKICIKFTETSDIKLTHTSALKSSFAEKVKEFWEYLNTDEVPLARIEEHQHKATINAVLHGKSQQLIKELKAQPTKSAIVVTKKGDAKGRGNSLLERIRAKAAAAEAPPSQEELVKRAAEGRYTEVQGILKGCRAKGESRGLKEIVEMVRESVKNPIGVKEAEMAVRLVGEREEWCNVKEVGGVGAVVFGGYEGGRSFV
ncbi:hypothetical protein FPQ18DRAFT_312003 [Pyronema domesticum]|uniref:Similar to Pc12g15650 [Penicillium chrysogenum Wisconsin 54-1255] acc. no. XP_002558364 n=1 Tax=Pyronema omphalodes (strain CBS 100304) TaxID=1076935 RepID=U4LM25_PYROM|nr:hypothetical protein FPQ18DRAFT_312003 [Pyronema domesticum]CCX30385.1 Similar to Pc12g15650 [Penicillium chrysogenum Wisconsin 54-1255]; acc. no. XP_002558364 [Pyronema omphalodes CBS 100304]